MGPNRQDDFQRKFALEILRDMPQMKKVTLSKQLDRNEALTSERHMSTGTIRVYKEGWYLVLNGTRCQFRVWAGDGDDKFKFGRKPQETKLHLLYEKHIDFISGDFRQM